MTLEQLLTICNIVDFGSFKAASEAMHKSQPSLSMAIKKLEEEFNITLFDRSQYRPELTQVGKEFSKKAQEIVYKFKELEKLATELGTGIEPEIHICADAIFPIENIKLVLSQFFTSAHSTRLKVTTDVLEGVIDRLRTNSVHFALGPDYHLPANIEKVKIIETTLIPVISPEFQGRITLELLEKLPQVVIGSSLKEKHHEVYGGVSHQYWYTSDFAMKEQFISSGLGWGKLPCHQLNEKLNNRSLIEIKNIPSVSRVTVPLYLIRNKNMVMGPNAKKLWKQLSSLEI